MAGGVFIRAAALACMLSIPLSIPGEEAEPAPDVTIYAGREDVTNEIYQGEAFLIRVETPGPYPSLVSGIFAGKEIVFQSMKGGKVWFAVCGIDLKMTPGNYPLELRMDFSDRTRKVKNLSLRVAKRDFPVEYLTLPPEMTELDEAALKQVREDSAAFAALWNKTTKDIRLQGGFQKPLPGEVTSPFGQRRIINGQPKSPHTGQDLRAASGEDVLASNAGKVVLVRDCFFSGKSVVLDHGNGIYSMYFHLSEYLVKPGDRVGKGQAIGRAGATGRSTAPHLHWGFRVVGARVDPDSVLALGPVLEEIE